jgi:8-oxo-dGTP pyrophosphatase MutT (NUDIX family)
MANKKIFRSAMIPFCVSGGEVKMLFMKPSSKQYGGDSFQLIKGKIEEGETPLQAAIREAQEESGLFPPNINGEPHDLGVFLGRTHVFVCEIKDPTMFGDPNFETESTKWMTPDEFQSKGRDLHKPVVKAAVRYIQSKFNQHDE